MRLAALSKSLSRVLPSSRRKVWPGAGFCFIQLRALTAGESGRLQRHLTQSLNQLDVSESTTPRLSIHHIQVLPRLGVVLFLHESATSPFMLVQLLEEQEFHCGFSQRTLSPLLRFPADDSALLRGWIEAGADIAGLGFGWLLARVPGQRKGAGIDISALTAAVENIPELRGPLDRALGRDNTELLLTVISNFGEAMSSGWSGSATDLYYRYHVIRAQKSRMRSWQRHLPTLLSAAATAEPMTFAERDSPVPPGPVERYSQQAAGIALGGFSFGLAATHRLDQAAASLFSGVPKPARLAQAIFQQRAGISLEDNGMLVLNPDALKLLDRISTIIIDHDLLAAESGMVTNIQPLLGHSPEALQQKIEQLFDFKHPDRCQQAGTWMLGPLDNTEHAHPKFQDFENHQDPHFVILGLWHVERLTGLVQVQRVPDPISQLVVNRIRAAGHELYVADHDHPELAWLGPTRTLPINSLSANMHAMQKEGEVILYVSRNGHAGLSSADIGLGLRDVDDPVPWHADLIAPCSLESLWPVLELSAIAHQALSQAVNFAKIEAVAGLVLAMRQLDLQSIARIKIAANLTACVAMLHTTRCVAQAQPCPPALKQEMTPWHALSPERVLALLQSSEAGLELTLALARRTTADSAPPPGTMLRVLRNWQTELINPLTPMLAAGAAMSALTGSAVDAALIVGVVIANGLIGGIQRTQVERALDALNQQEVIHINVLREQQLSVVAADELVRGDIIVLQAGELVPADCRLLTANHLEVDESSLTGESLPVKKSAKLSFAPTIAERTSMLYASTTVVQGRCKAVVVATGLDTEARRSLMLVANAAPATGVEARLESITARTLPISAISGALVLAAGLARQQPTDQLINTGVSLAVAAVPEGLPILSTMAQLASAKRLSHRGALVRNPKSIEALGRIDVLCADKTGTLTEGKLTLLKVSNGSECRDIGDLTPWGQVILIAALRASPDGFVDPALPHTTDQAVFDGARRIGLDAAFAYSGWRPIYERQFKSERGYHAVLGEQSEAASSVQRWLYVKGVPDKLLPRCQTISEGDQLIPLDSEKIETLLSESARLANQGLRVLAVARKHMQEDQLRIVDTDVKGLNFCGFIALADPVRTSAKQAVASLASAGVNVMMITGDHPATASAIARELGLTHPMGIITGAELDQLDNTQLHALLPQTSVFARVTPAQKARIVDVLQQAGHAVAMTGDGANDAAAIRLADVGIALGADSTPAARAAADLLVATEDIDTIVRAVQEGRALWSSVKDAVSLLVGGNLGEIGFTLVGGLLDGRSPLNARQLLLVNLLTDSLPALAVALRRPAPDSAHHLLHEGPERSLGIALTEDIRRRALATGGAATLAWSMARIWGSPQRAGTVALVALVGGQLAQTLATGRSSPLVISTSIGSMLATFAIVQTPGLSRFFGCTPLGPIGLTQAGIATVLSALGSQWRPALAASDGTAPEDAADGVTVDKTARKHPLERRQLTPSQLEIHHRLSHFHADSGGQDNRIDPGANRAETLI